MKQILVSCENGVLECSHLLLSLMSIPLEMISETCIFQLEMEGVHVLLYFIAVSGEIGTKGVRINDQQEGC